MKEEITTTDLSKFGNREKRIAGTLLIAMCEQGLPDDFEDDEVIVMFNTYSGSVFLTNSEYQTAMMNCGRLESWYSCPYCGHEGFKEDMEHEAQDEECTRYLTDIGVIKPPEATS